MITVALLGAYFVSGIFSRFPWKADEPYSFGIVWEILEDNSWLIPQVADQPFVEKPPLVYWTGAVFAKLLPALPPYESSRIAILLFVLASVIPLWWAAKWLHAEGAAWGRAAGSHGHVGMQAVADRFPSPGAYSLGAILLMAGTLGFPEHIHKLTADLGRLAGATVALCGLVAIGRRSLCMVEEAQESRAPIVGGLLLGTGLGVAFMSKGLLVPGILVVTWIACLPIPAYRRRADAALLAAALASAPWLLIWPFLFHQASPVLFDEWLWNNNVGRFLGYVTLGGNNVSSANRLLTTLVMGSPSLILCLGVVARTWWFQRNTQPTVSWRHEAPAHLCMAIYIATSLFVLGVSASMRDIYLLPVLPAMILLGLPALALDTPTPFSHAKRWVDIGFGLSAIFISLVWLSLVASGDLALWPWLGRLVGRWLPLPFDLRISWPATVAVIATLIGWFYVVRYDPLKSLTIAWCSGIAMIWVVVSTLLLPWIDAARSYKEIFGAVTAQIAASDGCLATLNLGESELALLEYLANVPIARSHLGPSGTGIRSRPNAAADACDKLIVLSNRASGRLRPNASRWTRVWSGSRPADRGEQFTLYRKLDDPPLRRQGQVDQPGP